MTMPAGRRARFARRAAVLALALPLLAACHGSGSSPQTGVTTVTVPASSPAGAPSSSAAPQSGEPGIVAVTSAGALVTLNPSTGSVDQTLVSSGVIGDEVSVSPDGSTVYFAQQSACDTTVESIPITGGSPTAIAAGELPAISPDGTKLAFAEQPLLTQACVPNQSNLAPDYKLVIRSLSSGTQNVLPLPPQVQKDGLPFPISHLSWASDNVRLAVSVASAEDNEGWALYLVDTDTAKYYASPGAGITFVPVTGTPDAQRSYIREGIFLPDGNLFISRACCGGVPIHNTSRLMWEVDTSGALIHQVAIGYPNLDHVSLAADPTGDWLLYVAGGGLYVSQDGNRPTQIASGMIAAAWS